MVRTAEGVLAAQASGSLLFAGCVQHDQRHCRHVVQKRVARRVYTMMPAEEPRAFVPSVYYCVRLLQECATPVPPTRPPSIKRRNSAKRGFTAHVHLESKLDATKRAGHS